MLLFQRQTLCNLIMQSHAQLHASGPSYSHNQIRREKRDSRGLNSGKFEIKQHTDRRDVRGGKRVKNLGEKSGLCVSY